MASSSTSAAASSEPISAAASSEPIEVPPLPHADEARFAGRGRNPQRKGNRSVGRGRLYADEAVFLADVEQHKHEHNARAEQVKERERAQERVREHGRDRSERQLAQASAACQDTGSFSHSPIQNGVYFYKEGRASYFFRLQQFS